MLLNLFNRIRKIRRSNLPAHRFFDGLEVVAYPRSHPVLHRLRAFKKCGRWRSFGRLGAGVGRASVVVIPAVRVVWRAAGGAFGLVSGEPVAADLADDRGK